VRLARLHRPALRPGTVAIWAAVMISFLAGMVAFAVDIGYIALVRNHLQVAADAGAMAGAGVIGQDAAPQWKKTKDEVKLVVGKNYAGGRGEPAQVADADIIHGTWNETTGVFTPGGSSPNAVKVITRKELNLFFGAVLGTRKVTVEASAIAMKIQRDIAFVIDMSGSMNNDTEIWATDAINGAFPGYPTVGSDQMTALFEDFGFGDFPGELKYVGESIPGYTIDDDYYTPNGSNQSPIYDFLANNTSSPLRSETNSLYQITGSTGNSTKKRQVYRWLIDKQLAHLMPDAIPAPSSADWTYWADYLDYVLTPTNPPGTANDLPTQSNYRFTTGANPYADAWPDLTTSTISPYQNKVGYATYVQFMMDYGRNWQAAGGTRYTPLSRHSSDCPWKLDTNANSPGYQLEFPPREQPTHATRLAVMAAINRIKALNQSLADNVKDHVSVITFDTGSGTVVKHALSTTTCDYEAARAAVRDLQAVSDYEYSTASEHGLIAARNHLNPATNPTGARANSTKILVFLSDGLPNVQSSSDATINTFLTANPTGGEWYTSGSWQYERNAVLMQINQMQALGYRIHAVGVGLGADRPLMDRMARMSGTALTDPLNPTGPKISSFANGNPADYQARLTSIFGDIVNQSSIKLVE
jgi:hypothetical protein